MSLLLSLPQDVCSTLFSDWIVDKDITHFDSSLGSRVLRPQFLDVLKSLLPIRFESRISLKSAIWMQNKGLRPMNFALHKNMFKEGRLLCKVSFEHVKSWPFVRVLIRTISLESSTISRA